MRDALARLKLENLDRGILGEECQQHVVNQLASHSTIVAVPDAAGLRPSE